MSVDQPDIENELGAPGARELLASTSAAHLAYTGKDGTPRVIPVGVFWTGEQFVIATATTAPKVAALSARPDAALAINAGDTPEQARPYLDMGVRHFCMGWDVGILFDWFKSNGAKLRGMVGM